MLPPASKNVASGGPVGSNGKGAVLGSSETPPPRPPPDPTPSVGWPPGMPPRAPGAPAAAAPAPAAPAAPAAAAPAPAAPRPRPRPGGALLARIHTPVKSILPSAVRGAGAS